MINYSYADDMLVAGNRDLLITDGTVTVSGTSYSVTGATVTITNELLDQEAFELHQSLNSSSQLTFGSCEASSISFVIHDNIPTLKGKTLKVYLIPNADASKMLQIGVFKVEEDKLSADRTRRNITAYDALYEVINSDVAGWYNTTLPSASSSMTLSQFRAAFLSHFSITAESATLVNDSITITRTIEPEQLSGADVIKAICEINGCFGKITNEGKFRFVELATDIDSGLFPAEDLYPADDLYPEDIDPNTGFITQSIYTDIQFEDYQSEAITQLTIRTDDEDVGVTVGTSGNRYVITGNFLVFGYNATALTSAATNALTKMSNRPYTPCTVNAMGNPVLETGDPIRVNTKYRGFLSYILERKLSGIQALRDTYTVQGEQYHNDDLNSITSQFKQLQGKTLKIKADIEEVSVELSDLDTRESTHYSQTSSAITSEATRATNAEGALSSRITQTATDITSEVTRATTAEGSLSTRITQNAESIATKVENSTFQTAMQQTASSISSKADAVQLDGTIQGTYAYQTALEIGAKASSYGGQASSFAWSLNAQGFKLQSSNVTVLDCDSSGVTVNGEFHSTGTHGSVSMIDGHITASTGGQSAEIGADRIVLEDIGMSTDAFVYGNYRFKPTQITVGGTTYTVLAHSTT